MVCSRCGKPLPAGTSFCPTCNAPGIAPLKTADAWVPPAARAREAAAAAPGEAALPGHAWYAGFWIRAVAYAIDAIVVSVAGTVVTAGVGFVVAFLAAATGSDAAAVAPALGALAMVVTYWLYFALMESSGSQATLGKMALGLAVTDEDGGRIGFGRATGRYFGKLLSALVLGIGFLMAGLTERKQALHDRVAGTLVVRRRQGGAALVVAIVAGAALGGVFLLGVLAAIAVPNFLRYQLRAKASEAQVEVPALAQAELAQQRDTGRFVPLALPADGAPGTVKLQWSEEDLAAAREAGWTVAGATYFRYAVAVEAVPDGREAFSICAESDLDGDGTHAAVVLWYPAVNEAGEPTAPPPAPPCAHDPALARPLEFRPGDPIGQPVRVSPASVF